jgi:hypothetical protein
MLSAPSGRLGRPREKEAVLTRFSVLTSPYDERVEIDEEIVKRHWLVSDNSLSLLGGLRPLESQDLLH